MGTHGRHQWGGWDLKNVYCRAYIAFRTEDLVAKFSREYDGHIFKDKAGLPFPPYFFDAWAQNVAI